MMYCHVKGHIGRCALVKELYLSLFCTELRISIVYGEVNIHYYK